MLALGEQLHNSVIFYRDPEVILDEEQAKRPCKTFMSTGECQFMDNCRFSHLTEQKRKNLEQQIAEKRKVNNSKTSSSANDEEGRKLLDSWLEGYHNKHKTDEDRDATVKQEPVVLPQYTIPPHVLAVPNPPPSLLPPPPDAFENLQFLDWG